GHDTGKWIDVRPGDFIAYLPTKGGSGTAQGGWYKCSEDQEVNPNVVLVGESLSAFRYDEGRGALYHTVRFKAVRRFRKKKSRVHIPSEQEIRALNNSEFAGA